jgi:hypothetical protein
MRSRLHCGQSVGQGSSRGRIAGTSKAGRQQGQRIDVPLWITRRACAEIDVGLRQVDHAARSDRTDDRALRDARTAHHPDRPEVHERGGVAERRLDRHRLAAGRHRPSERDHSLRRSEHRTAARSAEIDTAMLAGRVRMRVVERKRPQHRTVDGPRPGAGVGDRERTRANDQDRKSPHSSSSLPVLRTALTVARPAPCCQY